MQLQKTNKPTPTKTGRREELDGIVKVFCRGQNIKKRSWVSLIPVLLRYETKKYDQMEKKRKVKKASLHDEPSCHKLVTLWRNFRVRGFLVS